MIRTLLELIGAAVCHVKGKHVWRRRKGSGMEPYVSYTGTATHITGTEVVMAEHTPAHSVCTRCGLTKPVRARKAKQSTESTEGKK